MDRAEKSLYYRQWVLIKINALAYNTCQRIQNSLQTLLKESKTVRDVKFHPLSGDKTLLMMFDDVTIRMWQI